MRISDWSSDVCSSDLAAFVDGSVAKKTDTAGSDIDLMLVSNELSYGELFSTLEDAGMMLGRPVNPTILSREEFDKRIANQESFLTRVMETPKIWIMGKSRSDKRRAGKQVGSTVRSRG